MTTTARYCRGCNEQFVASEGSPYCPRCQQRMTALDVAPTMELAETACHDPAAAVEYTARQAGPACDLRQEFVGRTFNSYFIEDYVGKGGMAWVFRARHNSLQRPCAIKILSPELSRRSPDFLELFVAEARAAASVVHPHIVTVHNIGQTGDFHYIELEYVPGCSLQSVLQDAGRLTPLRATQFLLQSCSALAEAHRCGLIHRDFKPSNILVGPGDFAKLADFGLAKRVAADRDAEGVGKLAGTPYYMAPELFAGQPADARSDVYAVGVSYYYLLTGNFPFLDRNLTRLIRLHAEQPVPDPRSQCADLPGEIAELIAQCLAKDPRQRPEDGLHLQQRLREVFLRLRDIRSLVDDAVGGLQLAAQMDGERLMVQVPLPEGRQQRVYIEDRVSGPWSEQLVKIYSLCGPVREDYLRHALELNADISHGSLAIEKVEGSDFFVMINLYPRATCDAEEIRQSILDISHWADQVERALTGEDRH